MVDSKIVTTTYNDVVHIVFFDLGGEVYRDLNFVLSILFLDSMQKGVEPFGGAKIADNPCKVNLHKAMST